MALGCISYTAFSQNSGVGVGTTTPVASAALEVNSSTQGFLPPRMTGTQMFNISNPAEGLVVYCMDCLPIKGLRVFNGTDWVNMNGSSEPDASFTFTGNYYQTNNFYEGRVMDNTNVLYVEINVTDVGRINFSAPVTNGLSVSSMAIVSNLGNQFIPIYFVGTQTNYSSSGTTINLTGEGDTTISQSIIVNHVALGSVYSSFSNGSENFSDNATCVSKPISANHTAASCSGAVTLGSNSYNVVLINGQCWMQSNLKEVPTAPCSDAPNTGCNIWLATSPGDIGSWGYYNTVTTNGTAGWATTEPAANEGLLYQWSAAMNGNTTERAQGVCPTGWHIPSDCEWMYLEHGQGMAIGQQTTDNAWRNTTGEGNKLRGVGDSWNNSSGFTALLAGSRNTNGTFSNRGSNGVWWSSSEASPTDAQGRALRSSQAGVDRGSRSKARGFFVRCLKD